MPATPGSIAIDPSGRTAVVIITSPAGAVTAYTAQDGVTPVTFPQTISVYTVYYLTSTVTYTVSAKQAGVEMANSAGGTQSFDLSAGGNAEVRMGSGSNTLGATAALGIEDASLVSRSAPNIIPTFQLTAPAAGAAAALPATPAGYFAITINGTARFVAYY